MVEIILDEKQILSSDERRASQKTSQKTEKNHENNWMLFNYISEFF